MTLSVRPLTPTIGAELDGLDLTSPLSDETVAEVRAALLAHLVVFMRGQNISSSAQRDFCARFGPIVPSVGRRLSDEVEGVTVLDQVRPVGQGADEWHSDHMFAPEPPLGTVLRAVQLPSLGGDTCYTSLYAAYEALSPSMQSLVDELSAENSNARTVARVKHLGIFANDFDREPSHSATHPVVRAHPETGRKALYISPRDTLRICELSESESAAVLSILFGHIASPEFQCRFRWEVGSVAFWDNRVVLHRAVPDYGERRVMHRAMVGGGGPVVAPSS